MTSPALLPTIITAQDRLSTLLFGLMAGLVVGTCEELRWTGFALPRVRPRYGIFGTGLLMGVTWGVWHLPPQVWYAGDTSGALALGILMPELVFMFAVLPAYRVLMVWVYEHTYSLLVAMLMHGALVASLFTMLPAGITGVPFMACYLAVAVAVWMVVSGVSLAQEVKFRRSRSTSVA